MIIDIKSTGYQNDVSRVKLYTEGKKLKAHVMTFGCQQNEADSERARGILLDMGYELSDNYRECDIILVNTCAIREHAEMKALSMLGNFRAVKKNNPDLIVGVFGCMAAEPTVMEKIKKDFHYVSFTFEPNMLHMLPSLVLAALEKSKRTFVIGEDKGDIVEGSPVYRVGDFKAWVSIMYGCNNFCSYCIVPYVRGRERSRRSEDVLSECKELISNGVKEITLLGQNVNSYRSDISFAELLERIALIDGDFTVRFMTSHPKDVSEKLILVMKKYSGKIAPYFHLPLQSGSDSILKKMNRSYDRERFISVAKKLKTEIPGLALSTDVIIGFPGETEEDFEDTMNVLREIRFDMVYSFLYSKREGTKAASMTDFVEDSAKNDRMKKLLAEQDIISYEMNQPYVGNVCRVLVESVSKRGGGDTYTARTGSNKLVHFKSDKNSIGNFINVKIEKAGAFDLFATEINNI
ncbi:MAG: tRNA (N6-isopentenyl adenosine(37)-C2)-methylthiotransferase MiaB [Clostridia bacterium]|nr:tRNA (N6-isopentenyl adenosine(37)-C2)-methylthiotransferase MiaB [Clostridia bacterium]